VALENIVFNLETPQQNITKLVGLGLIGRLCLVSAYNKSKHNQISWRHALIRACDRLIKAKSKFQKGMDKIKN
jgi:hypothetical protein